MVRRLKPCLLLVRKGICHRCGGSLWQGPVKFPCESLAARENWSDPSSVGSRYASEHVLLSCEIKPSEVKLKAFLWHSGLLLQQAHTSSWRGVEQVTANIYTAPRVYGIYLTGQWRDFCGILTPEWVLENWMLTATFTALTARVRKPDCWDWKSICIIPVFPEKKI